MAFNFFSSTASSSSAPTSAETSKENARAFPIVPRYRWNKKVKYDSSLGFLAQMEENDEGNTCSSVSKYTKLVVHNLTFTFTTDTKVPYKNSDYTVSVAVPDGTVVTFGPLGKPNFYTCKFEDASEVEDFLNHVEGLGQLTGECFILAKKELDEKYKKDDEKFLQMTCSLLGYPPLPPLV